MYPLYYTVLTRLQKSRHKTHVVTWKRSLENPCCSAARSSHCPWSGRREAPQCRWGRHCNAACTVLPLIWSEVSYLARGTMHYKDVIQHCCRPPSNTLFNKLILHGICTSVSLSLTVLSVKCPGAASSSWSVTGRMTLGTRTRHAPVSYAYLGCSVFLVQQKYSCIYTYVYIHKLQYMEPV